MRQFIPLLAAALLGGTVAALLTLQLLRPAGSATIVVPTGAPASTLSWAEPVVFDGTRSAQPAAPSLSAAAALATPTVVHIAARATAGGREAVKALFGRRNGPGVPGGEGSGVIYSADGYVVTNYHVVQGTDEITVITSDRRSYPANIVGTDPKSDLAVLRINATGLPFLPYADSDRAQPGEWVLAVGSPLGLVSTVTAGIISAKGRNLSILRDLDAIESFIQTDAAVNPGNSGGPLVDAEGRLLGINTAIASQTGRFQGYSFAIPVNLVRRVVDDIIAFGSYRRPLLGIEISNLTQTDIQRIGLRDVTEGVLVDAVFPDGAAELAGFQPGDVITGVEERIIRDLPELTEIIGRGRAGDLLRFTIVRGNEVRELTVTLQNPEQN